MNGLLELAPAFLDQSPGRKIGLAAGHQDATEAKSPRLRQPGHQQLRSDPLVPSGGPDAVTDMTSEQAGVVVRQFAPQKQRPQELRLILNQPEQTEGGKGPGRSIGKNAASSLSRDRGQMGGKIGCDGVHRLLPQRWCASGLIALPKRLQIGRREN
jgi:hypothetical protein